MPKTLALFAAKNPHAWYKQFLNTTAIPNAALFGTLTMWGEFLTAITISVSCLYLAVKGDHKLVLLTLSLGLIGGIFLNLNFWLASAWMGPSGDSLNVLMLATELIGVYTILTKLKFFRKL
ncbi:hypothetical protein HY008_00125 [Candidatus Woesebacteria bacterium]|nr:hypothetical protein [Candidatus Woesebacteria bacterium]